MTLPDRWTIAATRDVLLALGNAPEAWRLNRICEAVGCLPSEAAAIESLFALDPDARARVARALDAIAKARTA